MTCPFHTNGPRPSRRGLLAAAGGLAAATGIGRTARADAPATKTAIEPFYGPHQAGIATPQQPHSYFAAFDLVTAKREDVVAMLRAWTDAAARLTAGQTAKPMGQDLTVAAPDGGTALDLPPGRLTLTFGFGSGLFVKDGKDRYGLARNDRQPWWTCRVSTATSFSPNAPAAIFPSTPARMIRKSPSTPCAS